MNERHILELKTKRAGRMKDHF